MAGEHRAPSLSRRVLQVGWRVLPRRRQRRNEPLSGRFWARVSLTGTDIVPFQPNSSRVGNVCSAPEAICNLAAHVEAPTWLTGSADFPPLTNSWR